MLFMLQVIQTIGNLSVTSGVTYKEQWLEFLRPIIHESIPEVKVFIDEIISIDDDSAGGFHLLFPCSYQLTGIFIHYQKMAVVFNTLLCSYVMRVTVAYDLKRRRRSVFHPSVTIKQGYLWKRRWKGGGCLAFFAPHRRYFWLKYDSFAYSSKPTDQVWIQL